MAEMRDLVMATGGMTVQTDTYHNVIFKVHTHTRTHTRTQSAAPTSPRPAPLRLVSYAAYAHTSSRAYLCAYMCVPVCVSVCVLPSP